MSSSNSPTRALTLWPAGFLTRMPNPMLSATFMFGNSAYDWKTIPTLRLFGARLVTSRPSMPMVPSGYLEPGDHPQGRRLAAARWPQERHELAALRVRSKSGDGRQRAELLVDTGQFQEPHRVLAP